jgi:hypothetical protein
MYYFILGRTVRRRAGSPVGRIHQQPRATLGASAEGIRKNSFLKIRRRTSRPQVVGQRVLVLRGDVLSRSADFEVGHF